jgi:hypothetical protein
MPQYKLRELSKIISAADISTYEDLFRENSDKMRIFRYILWPNDDESYREIYPNNAITVRASNMRTTGSILDAAEYHQVSRAILNTDKLVGGWRNVIYNINDEIVDVAALKSREERDKWNLARDHDSTTQIMMCVYVDTDSGWHFAIEYRLPDEYISSGNYERDRRNVANTCMIRALIYNTNTDSEPPEFIFYDMVSMSDIIARIKSLIGRDAHDITSIKRLAINPMTLTKGLYDDIYRAQNMMIGAKIDGLHVLIYVDIDRKAYIVSETNARPIDIDDLCKNSGADLLLPCVFDAEICESPTADTTVSVSAASDVIEIGAEDTSIIVVFDLMVWGGRSKFNDAPNERVAILNTLTELGERVYVKPWHHCRNDVDIRDAVEAVEKDTRFKCDGLIIMNCADKKIYKWKSVADTTIDFMLVQNESATLRDKCAYWLCHGINISRFIEYSRCVPPEYKSILAKYNGATYFPVPFDPIMFIPRDVSVGCIPMYMSADKTLTGVVCEFTYNHDRGEFELVRRRDDKSDKFGNDFITAETNWINIMNPLTREMLWTYADVKAERYFQERKDKAYDAMTKYMKNIKLYIIRAYSRGNVMDIGAGSGQDLFRYELINRESMRDRSADPNRGHARGRDHNNRGHNRDYNNRDRGRGHMRGRGYGNNRGGRDISGGPNEGSIMRSIADYDVIETEDPTASMSSPDISAPSESTNGRNDSDDESKMDGGARDSSLVLSSDSQMVYRIAKLYAIDKDIDALSVYVDRILSFRAMDGTHRTMARLPNIHTISVDMNDTAELHRRLLCINADDAIRCVNFFACVHYFLDNLRPIMNLLVERLMPNESYVTFLYMNGETISNKLALIGNNTTSAAYTLSDDTLRNKYRIERVNEREIKVKLPFSGDSMYVERLVDPGKLRDLMKECGFAELMRVSCLNANLMSAMRNISDLTAADREWLSLWNIAIYGRGNNAKKVELVSDNRR